jgi:hypothetical protein
MIRKDFIVAAYEWKTFWAGWITYRLSIDCDTEIIVTIKDCIKIWNVIALVVLEADAWNVLRLSKEPEAYTYQRVE